LQSLVVPLEINVALLGFNGDGAYQFQIAEKELADFLQKSLPDHRPSCLETGQQLEISYQLKYTVFHVRLVLGMRGRYLVCFLRPVLVCLALAVMRRLVWLETS
jgi:hypothetical protein